MAPKRRLDKGKAPMIEGPAPRATRSRTTGIVIREHMEQAPRREEPAEQPEQGDETPTPTEEELPPAPTVIEARRQPDTPVPSRTRPSPNPETNPDVQANIAAIASMVMGMVQTMQDFIRTQTRPTTETSPVQTLPTAAPTRVPTETEQAAVSVDTRLPRASQIIPDLDMKAFREMGPPTFKGEKDYHAVDEWIYGMEKVFRYMRCPEMHKVSYAAYMLSSDAERWWRTETRTLLDLGQGMTWEEFVDRLLRRYVPSSEQERRANEFMSLIQGGKTVEEYDDKFRSLSRFVPWAQDNPVQAARKFQRGLRPSIRRSVALWTLTKYEEILEKALVAELEEEEYSKIRDRKKSAKKDGRGIKPRFGRSSMGAQGARGACFECGQIGHQAVQCPQRAGRGRGGNRLGQARGAGQVYAQAPGQRQYAPGACYTCGEPGHMARDCPTRQGGGPGPIQRTQQQPMRGGLQARGRGRGPYQGRPHEHRQQVVAVVQAANA